MTFAHGTDALDYIFVYSECKMTAAESIHFFYCDFSHLAAETAAARPAGTVEGIRDGSSGGSGGGAAARLVTV